MGCRVCATTRSSSTFDLLAADGALNDLRHQRNLNASPRRRDRVVHVPVGAVAFAILRFSRRVLRGSGPRRRRGHSLSPAVAVLDNDLGARQQLGRVLVPSHEDAEHLAEL